ncbi:MAG: hypothetical protein AAGA56_13290 [Myxococcota bacterium]
MAVGIVAGALALAVASCGDVPETGRLGTLRLAGNAFGETFSPDFTSQEEPSDWPSTPPVSPLRLSTPITDRDGNVYILQEFDRLRAFVGRAEGGWYSSCTPQGLDQRRSHGWIGHGVRQAWFWANELLVEVNGQTGNCSPILTNALGTDVRLDFKAVIPLVRVQPTRDTVVAFIQSEVDPIPFSVLVDLRARTYSNLKEVALPGGVAVRNVVVLGTGADHEAREGIVAITYERLDTGAPEAAALFFDEDASLLRAVPLVDIPLDTPEYVLRGYLEGNEDGVFAGLIGTATPDGDFVREASAPLLLLDANGGGLVSSPLVQTYGVHRWRGEIFVVGLRDRLSDSDPELPAVAPIGGNKVVGEVRTWGTSLELHGYLAERSQNGQGFTVVDDRVVPRRDILWPEAWSAIGPYPFLSEYSLHPYTDESTAWVFGGLDFVTGGSQTRTQVAFSPTGVAY